jgi:hypothetical protein
MFHASSFRGSKSGSERTGAARGRRPKLLHNLTARRHSFVPKIETLEDRTVPSGGYVFQTIDPPQASQLSVPTLINSRGDIVGLYTDASSVFHGYLLSGGQYTTLDDPNAGTGAGQGTVAAGINAFGNITGAYLDANSVLHGYLLSGGQYTTLDDPNAGTGALQGTEAATSNASGSIVGVYFDANSVFHGFLLSGGQYTTLDDPNAGTGAGQGTNAQGNNAAGVIVGFYFDANSVQHGFLLSGGQYTTIDDPAGVLGSAATGLNDHGQITGVYIDANGLSHGFLLSDGQYTTLDDPAGVLGNGADSINNSGKVVGVYADANGVTHGYLATKAHGNSAIGSPSTASNQGSTTTLNSLGSFDSAIADLLSPAHGTLSLPSSSPLPPSKPEPLATLADVSRVDQVFAEDRSNTENVSFKPSKPTPESSSHDWLHNGPADDFVGKL